MHNRTRWQQMNQFTGRHLYQMLQTLALNPGIALLEVWTDN